MSKAVTVEQATPPKPAAGNGRLARLKPDRDSAVDFAMTLLLSALALLGLYHVFAGPAFLVVGLVGVLVSSAIAYVIVRLEMHPLLAVALLVGGFVLAGGIAIPDHAVAGFLPSPGLPLALFSGLIEGWKSIVTVAPPVGLDEPLGVVPYTCGFVAGTGGMLLARKTDWPLIPALPAFIVLVGSLFLGTRDPVSVLAQGSLFAAASIGWGSIRANRPRRSADGEVYWPRVISGVIMLLAVVLVALPLAGFMPLAGADDRFVLRDEIVPPFDPRDEPSPLGAYRSFRLEATQDDELVAVDGLPSGQRVRVATMDTYDGVVWVVGGSQATGSGRFERVGDKILPTPPGESVAVEVEILANRNDVWMPTVGWTRSVEFTSDTGSELARTFRYNRLTGTAAVPSRLSAGDTYVLDAQVPVAPDELPGDLEVDQSVTLPDLPPLSDEITRQAVELMGAGSPLEQATRLEEFFSETCEHCYHSDGGDQGLGPAKSAAGHSIFRIQTFLDREDGLIVGNAEQYAATMALLARSRGLPARVVLGFDPTLRDGESDQGGAMTFTSEDVNAWVEIAFEDVGWVAFDPTPDRDKLPDSDPPPPSLNPVVPPQDLPLPEHLQLPEETSEVARDPLTPEEEANEDGAGFAIPALVWTMLKFVGVPLLFLALVWLAIVGTKRIRGRRRRTRGTPVERLSGAWREVCDRARDRGAVIPLRVTRQEAAATITPDEWLEADRLAREVDALMFGNDDPDATTVDRIWVEVDELWQSLLASLGFRDRLRTTLSLASLRRSR